MENPTTWNKIFHLVGQFSDNVPLIERLMDELADISVFRSMPVAFHLSFVESLIDLLEQRRNPTGDHVQPPFVTRPECWWQCQWQRHLCEQYQLLMGDETAKPQLNEQVDIPPMFDHLDIICPESSSFPNSPKSRCWTFCHFFQNPMQLAKRLGLQEAFDLVIRDSDVTREEIQTCFDRVLIQDPEHSNARWLSESRQQELDQVAIESLEY